MSHRRYIFKRSRIRRSLAEASQEAIAGEFKFFVVWFWLPMIHHILRSKTLNNPAAFHLLHGNHVAIVARTTGTTWSSHMLMRDSAVIVIAIFSRSVHKLTSCLFSTAPFKRLRIVVFRYETIEKSERVLDYNQAP
jgi:hypothetical protein